MAIFKYRQIARQDLIYIFAVVAFPIHVWSIIRVLNEIPSWLMRLSVWDVTGLVAYTQAFALLETMAVFAGLVLLAVLLPARWFREKAVAIAGVLMFVTAAWFMFLHYNIDMIDNRQVVGLGMWAATYLVVIGVSYYLVQRRARVAQAVDNFVKRLAVLSFIYIFLDLLSIGIITIRNI